MTLSNQARSLRYRQHTLELLGRLGYGSARQIAKGVWGQLTPSTRKMASRLLGRLGKERLVVSKRDGNSVNGEQLYALTKAGVARLTYALPLARGHARDWLRHAHAHRTMANSVFVAGNPVMRTVDDSLGITELEIRSNGGQSKSTRFEYEVDEQRHVKIPDVVFNHAQRVWVEVENAWRSSKDMTKLVQFLRALFWYGAKDFDEVWLVVTATGAKTIGQRLRNALSHDDPLDGWPRQVKELDARLLQTHVKVWVLDADTLTLRPEPLRPPVRG